MKKLSRFTKSFEFRIFRLDLGFLQSYELGEKKLHESECASAFLASFLKGTAALLCALPGMHQAKKLCI